MIRVAAVGDVHLAPDARDRIRPHLAGLAADADVLLIAGDLTNRGTRAEAEVAAAEFAGLDIPVVAVLGNHDYQSDSQDEVAAVLRDSGMVVLEGAGLGLGLPCGRLRIARAKGL